VGDDFVEEGLAGLHHCAGHVVGGEDDGTMGGKEASDGGFAAAEIAGETYAEHQAGSFRLGLSGSRTAGTMIAMKMHGTSTTL
jgi:hypothetical protein